MNTSQQAQIVRLKDEILGIGYTPAFEYKLKEGICTRDQDFQIGAVWYDKGEKFECQLHIFKLDGEKDFVLDHYRVSNRQPIPIPQIEIQGIDVVQLDQKMQEIDWFMDDSAFTAGSRKDPDLPVRIQDIYSKILRLGMTQEGKQLQLLLQAKHWSHTQEIETSAHQQQLDAIELPFVNSLIVPVRNTMPPGVGEAFELLASNDSNALTFEMNHQLYRVTEATMMRLPLTDTQPIPLGARFHYFTSLTNAYKHVESLDDKIYLPMGGSPMEILNPVSLCCIYDQMDNQVVATKTALTTEDRLRYGKQSGWYVNPAKIESEVFQIQTGVAIDQQIPLFLDESGPIYKPRTRENTSENQSHRVRRIKPNNGGLNL